MNPFFTINSVPQSGLHMTIKRSKTADRVSRLQSSPPVVKKGNGMLHKRLKVAATSDIDARRYNADERRGRRKQRNAEIYQRQKVRRKEKREAKKLRAMGSDNDADPVAERANRTPAMGLPKKGQLLILKTPSTHVGRLSSVVDWHRQIGKIYREMRRGQIDPGVGTRLTYVANVGATTARIIEATLPKGVSVPPDLSRLDSKELEQLDYLLTKAAGNQQLITIDQGATNE
jgi:hypothetical protein